MAWVLLVLLIMLYYVYIPYQLLAGFIIWIIAITLNRALFD